MSTTIPDALPDVKLWLASLGVGPAYFRLPPAPQLDKITTPFIRLSRSGGGPDANSEVPETTIRCTVEVFGQSNASYEAVRTGALAIEQAVFAVSGQTLIGNSTMLLAANVLNGFDSPDPDTGFPRYIIMLSLSARGV